MRVVSLVPSLTETLVEAGVDVVGRTRFCIHPSEKVKDIPIMGGTKSADWSKLPEADLVIFDKEENTKDMADSCPIDYFAVHVTSLGSLENALDDLSVKLSNSTLSGWAKELRIYIDQDKPKRSSLEDLPGLIKKNKSLKDADSLRYLIWKKPFMEVGKNTFIADMFRCLGYEEFIRSFNEMNYPKLDVDLEKEDSTELLVLSSEPYPFGKEWDTDWEGSKRMACLIDGELYSWFGIRSIKFLRENLKS